MAPLKTIVWTAKLISAYVSHNSIPATQLISSIFIIHSIFLRLCDDQTALEGNGKIISDLDISSSINSDYIVSFLDGRPYRSLKRHLKANGMTPEHYRFRFRLPSDYPMVSPGYSALRSRIAREIQLGVKPRLIKPLEVDQTQSQWNPTPSD